MPLVHECAAPDCPVVTMGAFCIDHERETVPPAEVVLLDLISDAAAQNRAADARPTRGRHGYRTRRPLRAVPATRFAARPR